MDLRICVFAYDFPHRKSAEVLTRLLIERFEVVGVVAAPWVELKSRPASSLRTKPHRISTVDVRDICKMHGIPYVVSPHNDASTVDAVKDMGATVGVIGGARILKGPVLSTFEGGIVNLHPGLIPEARGLDSLKWSILHGVAPGVTAHLIDQRVDAGRIILRRQIALSHRDSLIDVGLKIDDTQIEVLPAALRRLSEEPLDSFDRIGEVGPSFGAMNGSTEAEVREKFDAWKLKWVAD